MEAKRQFHKCVVSRAEEVDPDQRCDWTDLAYGFLLALGFEPGEETYMIASELEYK